MSSSVAWLQRGCGTSGFTLAQKPYSAACRPSQNVFGRLSVNSKRKIDLTDLKPYFHGTARRSGAPICFNAGLPYMPVTRNVSSLLASSMVSPSVSGHGYQLWRKAGAELSWNVCFTPYVAADVSFAGAIRWHIWKPVHGIVIDHASTQRWR